MKLLASLVLALSSCAATPSVGPFDALAPGVGLGGWVHLDGRPAEWSLGPDGVLEVTPGSGNIISRTLFRDARIELDFRCPLLADRTGQARGNSGVYVLGLYEVQVLDSFGVEPGLDTCGAIYGQSAPSAAACLPPNEWQHYTIDFTAPRFDEGGQLIADARMSVWLNGVRIQDDVQLAGPTRGAAGERPTSWGPLMLQDHGDRVAYRRIQITPRFDDEDREVDGPAAGNEQ